MEISNKRSVKANASRKIETDRERVSMYASLSKPQDQLELKEVGIRHKKT
jgi:hypothetical protein